MPSLGKHPYHLKSEAEIFYRVRARNVVGWSPWSPSFTSNRMMMKPKPVTPIIGNLTKDGFTVCWES